MPTIHVRDVSAETLTALKVRAARRGQSLQSYVRTLLIDLECASATVRFYFVVTILSGGFW